jgi:hypothetical protein
MGEARAQRLDLTGILALLRQQRDAARDNDTGQRLLRGKRHQHGGQALVAGGDTQHAAARGQRADQPTQHGRGVVAISQAVHHAGRALRPAIAWIADESREGDRVEPLQFFGGGLCQ